MVEKEAGARWGPFGKHPPVHACGGGHDGHLIGSWLLRGFRLLNNGRFRAGIGGACCLTRRGIEVDLRFQRFLLYGDDDAIVLLVHSISLVEVLNRIVAEGDRLHRTNALAVASGGESFGGHGVSGRDGHSADNGAITACVGVWPASGLCSDPSLVVYGLTGQRSVLVDKHEFCGHIHGYNGLASRRFIGQALLEIRIWLISATWEIVVLTCSNKEAFTRNGYIKGKPIGGQRTTEILPLSISAVARGGPGGCGEENAGLSEKRVGMNDNARRLYLFLLKSRVYSIKQILYLARRQGRSDSEQPCFECWSPGFVGRLVLEERDRGAQSREASY